MKERSSFSGKVAFPKTMPSFSSWNPLQAIYFKKRGVERIMEKNKKSSGTVFTPQFAKETKVRIERQSMMTMRKQDRDGETIPSMMDCAIPEEASETTGSISEFTNYDEDSSIVSIDWSLPGVEDQTKMKNQYDCRDTDYCDIEERNRKIAAAKEHKRKKSEGAIEMIGLNVIFLCDAVNWGGCTS